MELLREIDTLTPEYFGEILDYIGYIKYKRRIPETMLMSESALAEYWDSPEEDEAWKDL
jgi:hypothetical protein